MNIDLFDSSPKRDSWHQLGDEVLREIRRRFVDKNDLLAQFVSVSDRQGWLEQKLLPIRQHVGRDVARILSQFAIFFENSGNLALQDLTRDPTDAVKRDVVLLLYRIAGALDPLTLGAWVGMVTFHKEFGNRIDLERNLSILKDNYQRIMASRPEELGPQQRSLAEFERDPRIKKRLAEQGFQMPPGTFRDLILKLEMEARGHGPRLAEAQEQRAIDILLEQIPEGFWAGFREEVKTARPDHIFSGQAFRNCLRLHGFSDIESPTKNLDDVWEYLAIKAAVAAERKDWVSDRKKRPSRKQRTDIQGSSRMLGERVWSSCYKWSQEFFAELLQGDGARSAAIKANETSVRREVVISTMWIITDNWKLGKEPLEVMHDCFFHYVGVADEANPENPATLRNINERYNFLFEAKKGSSGDFLSCFMSNIMNAANFGYTDGSDWELARVYYLRVVEELKRLR